MLRVTDLCEGNSPITGEFPAQGASNAENVSIWWRHYELNEHCRTTSIARKFDNSNCVYIVQLHQLVWKLEYATGLNLPLSMAQEVLSQ